MVVELVVMGGGRSGGGGLVLVMKVIVLVLIVDNTECICMAQCGYVDGDSVVIEVVM